MLVLFLLFAVALICFLFVQIEQDWRQGFLSGAIVFGVTTVFLSEGLGLISHFSRTPVAFAWISIDIILALILFKRSKQGTFRLPPLPNFSDLGLINRLLLCLVITIILLTGMTSFIAPPNNWDSMTYHMSRVMHWLQNERLDYYPTYYTPQLYHPPFAELVIAHFQLLSKSDYWANSIQWFSSIGSIIGVSLIARELGASARGQLFASVFTATLPMGLLQSATTQNDYAVCFWLVCFIYFLVRLQSHPLTIPLTLQLSLSLGLALFTKTSAYVFSLPFIIWMSISILRQRGWKSYQTALVLISSVLIINIGYYLRTWKTFGVPITGGPEDLAVQYNMKYHSLSILLSNFLRNISLQLSTPFDWVNAKLNGAITLFHKYIGIDPSDPRTTPPGDKFGVFKTSFKEDIAGNTIHFLTLLATIGTFLSQSKLRQKLMVWIYLLSVLGSYLVLCWMLKWQPYNSRHHLTLFVIISPFVGWLLSHVRWRQVEVFLLIISISSLPWVFNAQFRPWFGEDSIFTTPRIEQYFVQRKWTKSPYIEASQFFQTINCNQIGFFFENDPGGNIWEYPLWVLLGNQDGQSKVIRHLRADNISNAFLDQEPDKNYQPCAVIAVRGQGRKDFVLLNQDLEAKVQLQIQNRFYDLSWKKDPVYIYLPTKKL